MPQRSAGVLREGVGVARGWSYGGSVHKEGGQQESFLKEHIISFFKKKQSKLVAAGLSRSCRDLVDPALPDRT